MLIDLNQEVAQRLSRTELEIIRFINKNEANLPELSIVDIAFQTHSSPATVSRAVKKCTLDGFNELRFKSLKQAKEEKLTHAGEIMYQSLNEVQNIIECISMAQILQSALINLPKSKRRPWLLWSPVSPAYRLPRS